MVLLETKNLGIAFGGLKAVSAIDLIVKKGQLYGLIGPNGAGKTTLFNLITGVYKPTSGTFFLDGKELRGRSPAAINRAGIARTFQNIRLFKNMTVVQNVMVGLHNQVKGSVLESIFRLPRHRKNEKLLRAEARKILAVFNLEDKRNMLASNLPYGDQRKLEIARALATKPKLLLLDEPAAGMNSHETEELMRTIKEVRDTFDMTILLIEHDMKFVSGICDEITVLNFGTCLAQGPVAAVLKDPKVVTAYLGE